MTFQQIFTTISWLKPEVEVMSNFFIQHNFIMIYSLNMRKHVVHIKYMHKFAFPAPKPSPVEIADSM